MFLEVNDFIPQTTPEQSEGSLSKPLETNFLQTGPGAWTTRERTGVGVCYILDASTSNQ